MPYGLTRYVIGSSAFTEICESEYYLLVHAARDLIHALSTEEQFDLLIENYLDLETDLLRTATRSMVEFNFDYQTMQIQRNLVVNRRLLNVLSACRGYVDHTRHHLSHISSITTPSFLDLFDQHRREQHSASMGYQVMEELRNYTQHRAFPLSVTYNNAWIGDAQNDSQKMRVIVTPYLELENIERTKFKRSVYKQLITLGNKIDVKPLMRQYVGSLGAVHENLRHALEAHVRSCDNLISNAIRKFTSEHPDDKPVGLVAVARDGHGVDASRTYIFDKPTQYRRFLQVKNSNLRTLARRYVTSEAL